MRLPGILRRVFKGLGRTLAVFIWGRRWREKLVEIRSNWEEARALRRARKELEARDRGDSSGQ